MAIFYQRMKGFDSMWYVRLLLIALFLFSSPALTPAAADDIVARVGEVPIVTFEVESRATRIMPFNISYHGTVTDEKKNEVLEKALSELILRAYKICFAISSKLEVPEEQINERMERIAARFKTAEEFNKAVSDGTVESLRASIRRDLLAKIAEDSAVNSKVDVSDDQVRAYYEENKHTFLKPMQFGASQILIKVDPAATGEVRGELRKKAEGLMAQARTGEDFYNLAYYNSEDRTSYVGGDMGMFHKGQAAREIEEALLTLKVGEISDVVETLVGYHVLKLTQVAEPKQMSFDEVGPKIRAMLEKKQREALYEEWMENLKGVYPVERYDLTIAALAHE
jgi:parvulin-like peptidyl-prolyl isomerase